MAKQLPLGSGELALCLVHLEEHTEMGVGFGCLHIGIVALTANIEGYVGGGVQSLPAVAVVGSLQRPSFGIAARIGLSGVELIAVKKHWRRTLILHPGLCSSLNVGSGGCREVAVDESRSIIGCK